jgi:SurA N-terminal domain
MTRFCGSCGARLSEPVGRFCNSCGAEVGSGAEPAEDHPRKRSRSWLLAPLLLLAAAVVVAGVILLGGGGGSSTDSTGESDIEALPSPTELPPRTVALVSHVPSATGTITRAELDHAIAQKAAQDDHDSSPTPGSAKYDETAEAALSERLDSVWILGEAAEMGIDVTPGEIAEELAKLKRESFNSDRQYRDFVTESHYTDADIDERVEVQLLSAKIQKRIERNVEPPTQQAKQEDFADFVKRYTARWRSRTVCAPRYAVEDCSNGPSPSQARKSEGGQTDIPVSP